MITALLCDADKRAPIAVLPTAAADCVIDRGSLCKLLRASFPDLEVQDEPTEETRGLIYLPTMTDRGAPARLAAVLEAYPGIRWVQLPMTGIDEYVPLIRADPTRVWCNGKGTSSNAVAEHALTLMLSLLREIPERCVAKSWGVHAGRTLFGAHVLLVGYGAISQALVRLLRPFRCRISVVRRQVRTGATWPSSSSDSDDALGGAPLFFGAAELNEPLQSADIVVLAAALTPATHRMIGAPQLAAMKPGALLVNIGRGQLVDTDALVAAIRQARLGGVALDVVDPEPLPADHPLWSLAHAPQPSPRSKTQVLVTPHSAVTPRLIEPLLRERIRDNVRAYLGGSEHFEGIVDPDPGY